AISLISTRTLLRIARCARPISLTRRGCRLRPCCRSRGSPMRPICSKWRWWRSCRGGRDTCGLEGGLAAPPGLSCFARNGIGAQPTNAPEAAGYASDQRPVEFEGAGADANPPYTSLDLPHLCFAPRALGLDTPIHAENHMPNYTWDHVHLRTPD